MIRDGCFLVFLSPLGAGRLDFGHFSRSRWRAESPQCDSPGWSEHRERRPGKRTVDLFARPEGPEPNTHSRSTFRLTGALQGGDDRFGMFTWGFGPCASPQAVTWRAFSPHNVQTPRARKSPGAGEAQPKLLERTQWVANPTRKRLATPGSESCVVVQEGGTKRRQ